MNYRSHFMLILFLSHCPALLAMQALKKKQEQVARAALSAYYEKVSVKFAAELIKERIDINTTIRKQLGRRSLIAAFDPSHSEKKDLDKGEMGAVTISLLFNLKNPCAPIIVHTATWLNIVCMRNSGKLVGQFALNFNPTDWEIRSSQDKTMMIFIPRNIAINSDLSTPYKTFIDNTAISITGQKSSDKLPPLNDGEISLGIKIRHLPKVDDPFNFPEKSMDPCSFNVVGTKPKLDHYLLEMLVTSFDLKKLNIDETGLNYWDILLTGHGNNQKVSGMDHDAFGDLLDFLNAGINTRSFFYISCHSGAHLENPYQFKRKKQTQEADLKFLTMASSIFDLVVSSSVSLSSYQSYFNSMNDYFKAIQQSQAGPKYPAKQKEQKLLDAFDSFFIIKLNQDPSAPTILQYPAIRFPHTGWFIIPNVRPYGTFVINDSLIMRTINKGKKAITIDPKYTTLILESRYIPIPLIFNGTNMPLLVPKKVHDAIFIQEIRAPSCTLATFDLMLKKLTTLGNTGQYTQLIVSLFDIEKLTLQDYQHDMVMVQPGGAFKTSKSNDPSSDFVKAFKAKKEEIRKESKLHETMKIDDTKPVLELPIIIFGPARLDPALQNAYPGAIIQDLEQNGKKIGYIKYVNINAQKRRLIALATFKRELGLEEASMKFFIKKSLEDRITTLIVDSAPNVEGFYQKMGFSRENPAHVLKPDESVPMILHIKAVP